MTQLPLVPTAPRRESTYDPAYDAKRLKLLSGRVFKLMSDQHWRTLREIQEEVGGSEASVSARLREFRRPEFGGYKVNRKALGKREDGLFAYQLLPGESK